MIRVVHNEVEHPADFLDCENLGQIVERCDQSRGDEDHLILRVRIDGLDLPEDSFDCLERVSVSGVRQIDLESRPAKEIALSSLGHSSEYLCAVRDAAQRVTELFRTGRSDEANELMASFCDSLGVLVAAISGIASALPAVGKALLEPMNDLVHWLDQVLEGQAKGDWVHVADILEYEVEPRLEAWGVIMADATRKAGVRR